VQSLELAGRTEGSLGQLEVEPDQRVLAPALTRSRSPGLLLPAEEGVHDVGEGEPGSLTEAPGSATEGVAAQVVDPALLGVGEDLVRRRDLLEPLLGTRVGVDVRVVLARKSPIGLLERIGVGVAIDAEDGVGVG
jgi:hypothetical protein